MTKKKNNQVKEQIEPYDVKSGNPFIEERYEMINGLRYDFLSSPTFQHQIIATQLLQAISTTCYAEGIVVVAPMDVYLDEDNVFQPDIIYISNENTAIIKPTKIDGAPDLVAEILSPSTSTNDKIRKKTQYERFGVKEYWIIDPVHTILDQLILEGDKYQLYATYGPGDTVISPLFRCMSIPIDKLYEPLKRLNM